MTEWTKDGTPCIIEKSLERSADLSIIQNGVDEDEHVTIKKVLVYSQMDTLFRSPHLNLRREIYLPRTKAVFEPY